MNIVHGSPQVLFRARTDEVHAIIGHLCHNTSSHLRVICEDSQLSGARTEFDKDIPTVHSPTAFCDRPSVPDR